MTEISGIGVLTAFSAGVISFLSPCVLPLVPGYLSYVGEQSLEEMQQREFASRETLRIFALSLSFVLGFATVFMALGTGATAIGRQLLAYRYEANIAAGTLVIVFGVFLTGFFRPLWLQREFRYHGGIPGGRPVAAFLLGLAFAFGWTPCIGPILGAILTLSANPDLVMSGTALLAIYSLGLGIPFVAAALFTQRFLRHAKRLRRHGRALQIVAGVVLIVMGIAMITGRLTDGSLWLIDTLPWLSRIG